MLQTKIIPDIQKFIESNHYLKTCEKNSMDLDENFYIRKANTQKDFKIAFDIRWRAYQRFFNKTDDLIELNDFQSNATLLIVEDNQNKPVGSMRILDRRYGKIELDRFVDIKSLIPRSELPCAEGSRLSIPNHPNSKVIRFLLYKAFYLYCKSNRIDTMLISVRRITARNYRYFYFKNVGPAGIFNHPHLGNLEYHTYKCNISETGKFLKIMNEPLYQFFSVKEHLNINIS